MTIDTADESAHTHATPLRILCVEDDADIRALVRVSPVQIDGMQVELCADGHQACGAAAEFHPDLLLLDAILPDMTGVELLAELGAIPGIATVPAVFLTAQVRPGELQALQENHPTAIIPKPFDPMRLGAQLRRCVA